MSLQEQYTDTLRQSQEAWSGAIETWTNGVQKALGAAPLPPFGSLFGSTPFTLTDPTATVDQLFDFAEKVLEVQREFVKNLTSATVSVGQAVRHQAESAGQAVRNQAESTGQLIREHNNSVAKAATEKIADKYGDLSKTELQEELARRDLPKTGTVEELRTRLIEDDQK
jgi:hypothetical protein